MLQHEALLQMAASMRCRTIEIGGKDYLDRYFAGYSERGGQWWLHHFLRADSERHLHSHAFDAQVTVLRGSYVEEVVEEHDGGQFKTQRLYRVGDQRPLHTSTIHRIVYVEPGTWTLLHVDPGRLKQWAFIDDGGKRVLVESAGEDWWKSYMPKNGEWAIPTPPVFMPFAGGAGGR